MRVGASAFCSGLRGKCRVHRIEERQRDGGAQDHAAWCGVKVVFMRSLRSFVRI